MKLRIPGALAILLFSVAGSSEETSFGKCSPIVKDTGGNVTINCHDVDPDRLKQLERIPALIEMMLAHQIDSQLVLERLDELVAAAQPGAGELFKVYQVFDCQDIPDRTQFMTVSCRVKYDERLYSEVQIAASGVQFLNTLKVLGLREGIRDPQAYRWRDGQLVRGDAKATQGGNTAIIMFASDELVRLDFKYVKSCIEQHSKEQLVRGELKCVTRIR